MKNRILLLLFALLSLNALAQNNWNRISSSDIAKVASNEQYTWLLYADKAVRMNNSTMLREEFKFPPNLHLPQICLSYKDELWISTPAIDRQIFHLKNGVWKSYGNQTANYISSGGINNTNGTAIFGDPIANQLFIIRNNNLKVINTSDAIDFSSNFCMPNSNSIVYYSNTSSAILEIDTNGNVKNKFTYNRIGTTSTFYGNLELDKNQNIYVRFFNDGLFKIKFALNDTSIQRIITFEQLESLSIDYFKIDHQNNVVIKSSSFTDDTLYTVYNSAGSLIKSYKVISGTYGSRYSLIGFDQNNYPLSIYLSKEIWKVDDFDWNLVYKPINQYSGHYITASNIGNNGSFVFGGDDALYMLRDDSVIRCNFDTSIVILDPRLKGISNVVSGQQYVSIYDHGVLQLARIVDTKVYFEDNVPNSAGGLSDDHSSDLILRPDNKLLVLMQNRISIYNGKNNPWTSIELNPSDNISSVFSFCMDSDNNIWVGTNKGVAKVVNNLIVLQTQINAYYNILDIRYDKNENCLVFSNNTTSFSSVCLYYLSEQKLIKLDTEFETKKIVINQNSRAYFQFDYDKLWRYKIDDETWDVNFNDSIVNTPFSTVFPSSFDIDHENRVYIFQRDPIFFNNNLIDIFDEDGFVSTSNERIKHFTFYPNPTNDVINLSTEERFSRYYIYSLQGTLLQYGLIENKKIDLSELSPGIYAIKFIGENGECYRKVMKH